jgi:hypothetical protein
MGDKSICAVHPHGVDGDRCIDFRPDPNIQEEEQWQPEGASYYDGELILHRPRLTREEQLEILDSHPFFTGICPQCGHQFDRDNPPKVHWDCPNPECGWVDDSVVWRSRPC